MMFLLWITLAIAALLVVFYFKKSIAIKKFLAKTSPDSSIHQYSPTELPDDTLSAQAAVDDLSMEIDDLHWLLENKKRDLQQLKKEQSLVHEAAMKVDAMEDTIDVIEGRLQQLQSNLLNVRQTAIALDELAITCEQLENNLVQSQHHLQATQSENETLKQELEELQAYTAGIKEQRKLLEQKIRLLEELHTPS